MLVTIFGGGGFLGRYVAQELLAQGARVRVAERDPGTAMRIKPLGPLGQVQLVHADVRDPQTVVRAVAGADVVVNLVALLSGPLDAVNHHGAANVAQAAAAASGVKALVHVSAIGADANGASAYARSKGQGEAAVLAAFPQATILRPSVLFGPEDLFTNRLAGMSRLPVMPVIAPETRFQPLYVIDAARAVAAAALHSAQHAGQVYELGGPQVFSMMELSRWIAADTGHKTAVVAVPGALAALLARLPLTPITVDQWKMLANDNVVADEAKGLANLGVAPTPLAAVSEGWLVKYRKHGRFTAHAEA